MSLALLRNQNSNVFANFLRQLSGKICLDIETLEFHKEFDDIYGSDCLSSNPNVPLDFIEEMSYKPWDWGRDGLSSNPAITPDFINRHLHKPWHWGTGGLSSNPSITPEFVLQHLDKYWSFGYNGLSENPAIPCDFIDAFPNIRELCMETILEFIKHSYTQKPKVYTNSQDLTDVEDDYILEENEFDTALEDMISSRWEWDWGAGGISNNPNLTTEFLEKHYFQEPKPFDLSLFKNPAITTGFIQKHPELLDTTNESVVYYISINPGLTLELIELFIDKCFDWKLLSFHPVITHSFILEHPEKFHNQRNTELKDIMNDEDIYLDIITSQIYETSAYNYPITLHNIKLKLCNWAISSY